MILSCFLVTLSGGRIMNAFLLLAIYILFVVTKISTMIAGLFFGVYFSGGSEKVYFAVFFCFPLCSYCSLCQLFFFLAFII